MQLAEARRPACPRPATRRPGRDAGRARPCAADSDTAGRCRSPARASTTPLRSKKSSGSGLGRRRSLQNSRPRRPGQDEGQPARLVGQLLAGPAADRPSRPRTAGRRRVCRRLRAADCPARPPGRCAASPTRSLLIGLSSVTYSPVGRPSGASLLRHRQRVGDDFLQAAGDEDVADALLEDQRPVGVLLAAAGRPAASPAGGRSRGCGPGPRSGRRCPPGCRARCGGTVTRSVSGAVLLRPRTPAPAGCASPPSRGKSMPSSAADLGQLQVDRPAAAAAPGSYRPALADACRRRAAASARRPARRPA